MVFDDEAGDEAGALYLYGGADRIRANIATSQAAYAEASKRVDHSLTPASSGRAE